MGRPKAREASPSPRSETPRRPAHLHFSPGAGMFPHQACPWHNDGHGVKSRAGERPGGVKHPPSPRQTALSLQPPSHSVRGAQATEAWAGRGGLPGAQTTSSARGGRSGVDAEEPQTHSAHDLRGRSSRTRQCLGSQTTNVSLERGTTP